MDCNNKCKSFETWGLIACEGCCRRLTIIKGGVVC